MGRKLAKEILDYLSVYCPLQILGKISFIGYSLGGLIIRAALPHLGKIYDKLYTFMTLSSPHLGFLNNSSKIVEFGFGILTKWKKFPCLKELGLKDSTKFEDSYLLKLSKYEGLEHFKNIYFFSSPQDTYSPHESSRIQLAPKYNMKDKNTEMISKMAQNILGKLKNDRITRVDIDMIFEDNTMDVMIGRAAHISLIDNYTLIQMICYRYGHCFS